MYKPTQGVNSKKRAKAFLKKNFLDYDTWEKICPLLREQCHGFRCGAWKKATVELDNPGRMRSEDSIYGIVPGRCVSPVVTGKVEIKK